MKYLIALCAGLVVACSAQYSNPTDPSANLVPHFSCVVDGVKWEAKYVTASRQGSQIILQIQRGGGVKESFAIAGNYYKVGEYCIGACEKPYPTVYAAYLRNDSTYGYSKYDSPGELTVTQYDQLSIAGTFSCDCLHANSKIHITDGSFYIKF